MPEVLAASSPEELEAFFKLLYKDTVGYVLMPTLNRSNKDWINTFYKWPIDSDKMVKHVRDKTNQVEVYIGPALYKTPELGKKYILGSHVVWAEFDGRIPTFDNGTPRPAFWLNSSSREHIHVYWTLAEFCPDISLLESVNRALAHNLKADNSGWDAIQILRPPHTVNHKHGVRTSRVQRNNSYLPVSISDLASIPAPEHVIKELDTNKLPDILDVAARNENNKHLWELFKKPSIAEGDRSTKLMALGYYMAEYKYTDLDMYAVLNDAAKRWKKFDDRKDKKRRLLDLIERAREKYPLEGSHFGPSMGFVDLLETDIDVEWIWDDLLETQGVCFLSGPPGSGKTQLSLQFAIHLALGLEFLGFKPPKPRKILFLSLEMGLAAIKYFMSKMATTLTPVQLTILQENFKIHAIGRDIPLDNLDGQSTIRKFLQEDSPDGIFFDSFGMSVDEDLSSNIAIKNVFKFINRIKIEYDCFFWVIHHNRKAQALNRKPDKLSDLYGSQYIAANASAVLGIWPEYDYIELTSLKVRLGPSLGMVPIMRVNEDLNFERVTPVRLVERSDDDGDISPEVPDLDT